jgi:MerR family transcriptional regulator, copper efflux regulator
MTQAWMGPRALAQTSGVSTDTLRHYERIGLLPGTTRTNAGYRRYPPSAIARVKMIQRALMVGFSLKDLASVLGQRDRGPAPCRHVRTLVGERLDALEARVQELAVLRDEMRTLLREWDQRLAETPSGQRARLLDMLASTSALHEHADRASSRTGLPRKPGRSPRRHGP